MHGMPLTPTYSTLYIYILYYVYAHIPYHSCNIVPAYDVLYMYIYKIFWTQRHLGRRCMTCLWLLHTIHDIYANSQNLAGLHSDDDDGHGGAEGGERETEKERVEVLVVFGVVALRGSASCVQRVGVGCSPNATEGSCSSSSFSSCVPCMCLPHTPHMWVRENELKWFEEWD